MRKLATIEQVKAVNPVPNSDFLDMVQVRGWTVVTKRGEFQTGDLAVYFEIDSFLPIKPEFEFLRPSSFRKMGEEEGFRLKTIKLRGQVSQGLVLPLQNLPELGDRSLAIGEDVTDLLGVKLYETPIPAALAGQIKGAFPRFIRKTDQDRIQNLWEEYAPQFSTLEFEETIKLDGSSMTVYWHHQTIGVCSRNWELAETENNSLWQVTRSLELPEKLASLDRSLAIQGELMGPGVQKNNEKLKQPTWFVFDIWDIEQQRYLTAPERYPIVEALGLQSVPILSKTIAVFTEYPTLQSLLDHASGRSLNGVQREGLVYKSLAIVNGEIISFKVISNQWLLKQE